jgi:hypothetical protein
MGCKFLNCAGVCARNCNNMSDGRQTCKIIIWKEFGISDNRHDHSDTGQMRRPVEF